MPWIVGIPLKKSDGELHFELQTKGSFSFSFATVHSLLVSLAKALHSSSLISSDACASNTGRTGSMKMDGISIDTFSFSLYCSFHASCCFTSERFLFRSRWRTDRRSWGQKVKALIKKNYLHLWFRFLNILRFYQIPNLTVFSQRLDENIPSRSWSEEMVACWNLAFCPLKSKSMRSTLWILSLIASTRLTACLKSRPSESSVPGVSAK